MKIVRLVLLAACMITSVACNGESITQPDRSTLKMPANIASSNTTESDSTSRSGHLYGSGH
jgi:hypothetical protein